MNIDVYHGPNLNMLGTRDEEHYGKRTLQQINQDLQHRGEEMGVSVTCKQSNHEGALIDWIHEESRDGLIINPGGLTHTSVSLRDALAILEEPVVEVHLSNVHAREEFRRESLTAPEALAQVAGFGPDGYRLALEGLIRHQTT